MTAKWPDVRLKWVAKVNPRDRPASSVTPISFFPMERIGFGSQLGSGVATDRAAENGFTPFREGDVVIAKITPSFENGKGGLAIGLRNGWAIGTTELHVLRAYPWTSRRFLNFLAHSDFLRSPGADEMYGAAGQQRVSSEFLSNFRIPLPPLDVQKRIANFLDEETARIDDVIDKNRRLIELLDEKRSALISHTVTKGLVPGTSTIPTNILWLGDIPAHWDVVRLGSPFEVRVGRQRSPRHADGPFMTPYLRAANVEPGRLDLTDVKTMNFGPREREIFGLDPGDLLISEGAGSLTAVGASAQWKSDLDDPICYQNTLVRVRRKSSHQALGFLYWLAQTLHSRMVFADIATGANIFHLSAERVAAIKVPLPPPVEQKEIATFLDHETERIDTLKQKLQRQIELLTEKCQALITAAVTGELDV